MHQFLWLLFSLYFKYSGVPSSPYSVGSQVYAIVRDKTVAKTQDNNEWQAKISVH